ncbi:ATP-dependent DNA helicase [Alpinimonas psychrophila]|uniref:DNA 3'-5' helicase n=1 Tax=Alpinimonas psychrophila TaxID=748908 RepID=A0A7W3JS12_9MICO|nr:ATP-dependent DNA helicase [Alpinimonas psychrophila]MBA8828201.1 DNA helicase-2/ATP-dependent DNA helicase PcrA [Alpinimonas psychrophila]
MIGATESDAGVSQSGTRTPRISAKEIAEKLHYPMPTKEQIRIIESPLTSSIVIAAAGSGKTETMANRVVWLVSNGLVTIDQVLGMTFTRKAAGELAERIRLRLADLAANGLLPSTDDFDDMFGASVTTYNAFANRIFIENAHLIGRDSEAHVMSDASAWQLARQVARDGAVDEITDLDQRLDDVTKAILSLSRAMNDNLTSPQQVLELAVELRRELPENLPISVNPKSRAKNPKDSFLKGRQVSQSLPVLVALAQRYDSEKRRRGLIEFSDQVALAYQICTSFESVASAFRAQYRVVLLDEYQDTSVVQARLLAKIFHSVAVTAVGDPNQAIYGWRGASASSMDTKKFFGDFGFGDGSKIVFPLPHSWRNPQIVLDAANTVARGLASPAAKVQDLILGDDRKTGTLSVEYLPTIEAEAESVAQWFAAQFATWKACPGDNAPRPTAALLSRRIADLEPFKQALDSAGIRFHVVGLGGLLEEPLVVDLVSALRVMHDATADSELIRLLSGARWQIAPRDLMGLKRTAVWLAARDYSQHVLSDDVKQALRDSVVPEDGASLVDAVDYLAERAKIPATAVEHISEEGLRRLKLAGEQLARLRQRSSNDLRELVTVVIQELELDIETEANERSTSGQASIDAFMDAVATYLQADEVATLGGFLGWLKEAEKRERMSPSSAKPEGDVVQLMTVHGAKGLEWHLVAVVRQYQELPGVQSSKAQPWLTFGALPDELRGDFSDLQPPWNWRAADSQEDLEESYTAYKGGLLMRYQLEARRLAYVAITRAKQHLLLSGSFKSSGKTLLGPNEFLREIEHAGFCEKLPAMPVDDEVSAERLASAKGDVSAGVEARDAGDQPTWPLPPLGTRRKSVEGAAQCVRDGLARRQSDGLSGPLAYAREIELLLAERARTGEGVEIALPTRIPASRFKDFVSDPEGVARQLRRPLPQKPYRATLLGTIFHSWVENRSAMTGMSDVLDAHPGERDVAEHGDEGVFAGSRGPVDEAKLAELTSTFLASPWGQRKPTAVEIEILVPLGGNTIVCKIDAVYEIESSRNDPAGLRYEIVDWKTGKAPASARDLELKQYQLALYRLAYSQWANVDLERIDACLYFVAEDKIVRPERLYSESELEDRWLSVTGGIPR